MALGAQQLEALVIQMLLRQFTVDVTLLGLLTYIVRSALGTPQQHCQFIAQFYTLHTQAMFCFQLQRVHR